ncbi:chromatin accessibility complex protein 1-like [Anopheles albimanus]|uniref:Chromatin accessibility complex protein 1 n=1 Tax=Anopheles albimanus TaxID=7167 RepID=A0A182FZS9_ANOAL|nr:chromatin accessibility complex protein 1-like [Anopheles albimanus]
MDNERLTQLPMARIRTVMKTSPDMGNINQEALFLMCRAAEMFIEHMARGAHNAGRKTLEYKDLAKYVEKEDTLEFLQAILPKKITVKSYKALMANKRDTDEDTDSNEEDEDEEEEEEDDDDDNDDNEEAGEEEVEAEEEEDNDDVEVIEDGKTKVDPEGDSVDSASSSGDSNSVISIESSSDEKENIKHSSNKKVPAKQKRGQTAAGVSSTSTGTSGRNAR